MSLDFGYVYNILTIFHPLFLLRSKVAVVKSHHGILVKWSRYQDTGSIDPSLVIMVRSYVI